MTVQNRLHFRTFLHNRQVKEDFARPFPDPRNLIPFHVDHAEIFRFHEPFADLRRRADNAVVADTVTDVPVVCRGKPRVVNSAPDGANLFLNRLQIPRVHFFLQGHFGARAFFYLKNLSVFSLVGFAKDALF